jgi:hypothetical protein
MKSAWPIGKFPACRNTLSSHRTKSRDIFRRQADESWFRETLSQLDDSLRFDSVQFVLRLDEVYKHIEFSLPESKS